MLVVMLNKAQLGLGTVQLGLPYGNNSDSPIMPQSTAFDILQLAVEAGILFYDTAIAYGESESRLGEFELAGKSPNIEISTKIPAVSSNLWKNEALYWAFILEQASESITRLKIKKHNLLQFHQCDLEFLNHKNIFKIFERLLSEGICSKIGISVYTPDEADAAMATGYVSTLQVPVNIIDHRFVQDNFLQKVKHAKIELISRTAVLQGILISEAPLPNVKKRQELLKLRELAKIAVTRLTKSTSLEQAAFRFLFGNQGENLDVVLIGVDSIHTLRHNLTLIKNSTELLSSDDLRPFENAIQFADEHELLNPGTWNV